LEKVAVPTEAPILVLSETRTKALFRTKKTKENIKDYPARVGVEGKGVGKAKAPSGRKGLAAAWLPGKRRKPGSVSTVIYLGSLSPATSSGQSLQVSEPGQLSLGCAREALA